VGWAIGTPLVTLAGVTNLPLGLLQRERRQDLCARLLVRPSHLMLVMGGNERICARAASGRVCGFSFAVTQFLGLNLHRPYLTDILRRWPQSWPAGTADFLAPGRHGSRSLAPAAERAAKSCAAGVVSLHSAGHFVLLWGYTPFKAIP